MSNKWLNRLQKLPGAVVGDYNPYAHTIQTGIPSVDFVFGNSWGLPLGFSMVLYGPPKAGKSLLTNVMIGQLHKDDPEAIVVKFNTEMREMAQLTNEQAKVWGIDKDRYICYDTNRPENIFDTIEKDIKEMCQEGAPVKMIIIDSITGIMGRRAMNADTIMTQQIGDDAKTVQDGLKYILETVRNHKIALVLTSHVRAELNQLEQMRGNDTKMAGAWALKHFAEYFVYVDTNRSKDGKTNLLGEEFLVKDAKDMMDKSEKTGHKIRVTMKDSSVGPKGRTGEFTLDYNKGIVNKHEEIFTLGINRGIIARPNNRTYQILDKQWVGVANCVNAIKLDETLQTHIIKELRRMDLDKSYLNAPIATQTIANIMKEENDE